MRRHNAVFSIKELDLRLVKGNQLRTKLVNVRWILRFFFVSFLITALVSRYKSGGTLDFIFYRSADRPGYPWIQGGPVLGEHYFGDLIDTVTALKTTGEGAYFGIYTIFAHFVGDFDYRLLTLIFFSLVGVSIIPTFYFIKRILHDDSCETGNVLERETGPESLLAIRNSFSSTKSDLVLIGLLNYPMLFAMDRGNSSVIIGTLLLGVTMASVRGFYTRHPRGLLHAVHPVTTSGFLSSSSLEKSPTPSAYFAAILAGLGASIKLIHLPLFFVLLLIGFRSVRILSAFILTFSSTLVSSVMLTGSIRSLTYPFYGGGVFDLDLTKVNLLPWDYGRENLHLACTVFFGEQARGSLCSEWVSPVVVLSILLTLAGSLLAIMRCESFPHSMVALMAAAVLPLLVTPMSPTYGLVVLLAPLLWALLLGAVHGYCPGYSALLALIILALSPFRIGTLSVDYLGTVVELSLLNFFLSLGLFISPICLALVLAINPRLKNWNLRAEKHFS